MHTSISTKHKSRTSAKMRASKLPPEENQYVSTSLSAALLQRRATLTSQPDSRGSPEAAILPQAILPLKLAAVEANSRLSSSKSQQQQWQRRQNHKPKAIKSIHPKQRRVMQSAHSPTLHTLLVASLSLAVCFCLLPAISSQLAPEVAATNGK